MMSEHIGKGDTGRDGTQAAEEAGMGKRRRRGPYARHALAVLNEVKR
jgi:hypothetical protein